MSRICHRYTYSLLHLDRDMIEEILKWGCKTKPIQMNHENHLSNHIGQNQREIILLDQACIWLSSGKKVPTLHNPAAIFNLDTLERPPSSRNKTNSSTSVHAFLSFAIITSCITSISASPAAKLFYDQLKWKREFLFTIYTLHNICYRANSYHQWKDIVLQV